MLRAVLLQFFTLFLAISILQFDPLHPLSWLWSNVQILLTPSSWFYDWIAVAAIIGMGYIYGNQLKLNAWIPKNHIETFISLFQPTFITSALAHILAGGVLVRSYLGLYGRFNGLTVLVKGQKCLNVPHVFLVLSGAFTGLALWRDFHYKNKNVLHFPMIEQTGNSQLGRRMSKMIHKSLIKVAKELRFFLVFHFFIGYRIIDILSEISFMEKSVVPSSYVVTSLWSALDVLLICIVVNTLATFSLIMLRTILCINFTKRLRFDVTSGQKSIIQGMTSKVDLLKHLAFYDFSLMTNESKWRRNEFFALSQPGGHPHNWKGLKKACLDQIQDFIQQLLDSSQSAQPSENKNSAGVTTAEIPKSQPVLYSAGRNLAISEVTKTNVQPIHQISNNNNKTGESKDILSKIPLGGNYLVKILKSIKEKCSNNALINASPDAGVRAVFAKSQVVIWAVEGILTLEILFSSNHNILRSSSDHCFWASDHLIERF